MESWEEAQVILWLLSDGVCDLDKSLCPGFRFLLYEVVMAILA